MCFRNRDLFDWPSPSASKIRRHTLPSAWLSFIYSYVMTTFIYHFVYMYKYRCTHVHVLYYMYNTCMYMYNIEGNLVRNLIWQIGESWKITKLIDCLWYIISPHLLSLYPLSLPSFSLLSITISFSPSLLLYCNKYLFTWNEVYFLYPTDWRYHCLPNSPPPLCSMNNKQWNTGVIKLGEYTCKRSYIPYMTAS